MMKKLFYFLLIIPAFLFSQADLVKWYDADLKPTLLAGNITSGKITGSDGIFIKNESDWGATNVFFSTGGWPSANGLDVNKYIQFKINPNSGYKIEMSGFAFSSRTQGNNPSMQVRFSKNKKFTTYDTLQTETGVFSTYTNYNLKFPTGTVVNSDEELFIRIYVYNTYNNFHLQHNLIGTVAPTISGTVSLEKPLKPSTADDRAGTIKNAPVTIDILSNDDYKTSGLLSEISIVQAPRNGVVKVNGLNDITYTPKNNYSGYDQFYYTLTNKEGVSNTAKVEVQTLNGNEHVLVRWNKLDFSSTNKLPEVTGCKLNTVKEGLSLTNNASSTNSWAFTLTDLPTPQEFNGSLNSSKYLETSIKTDANHIAYLKSFKLSYRGQGSGNITIKYSKNANFSDEVVTIADNEPYTANFISTEFVLSKGVTLYPNESLFIRIYTYNTNNIFFIDFKENAEIGPAFTGVVSSYVPEPIACQTTVTWTGAKWDGGFPDIDKKVVIAADYDTEINGSFEACTLTVSNSAVLKVATDTAITVENEIITNIGSALFVKNDANLIQNNNAAINTGNITVERNATLKRLDYIYWASPVKNQNLKTFSPGTVNNRFYTYNESTDIFDVIAPQTNSFGNNATAFTSEAKGYAIRASNNYPAATATTPAPEQNFVGLFTGVPNNGTIAFPLDYQSGVGNKGNGYNLVGNPYASNIDFNAFAKDNSDTIEATAYFWTNLNPNPAMQASSYPNGDYYNNYAILNPVGGIPATSGKNPTIEVKPTTVIKIGQGFLVKAKKSGNLIFKNEYRTAISESLFINRNENPEKNNLINRYWLHLTSPLGVVTTTLVGYLREATNDYEVDYDADLLAVGTDALFTEVSSHKLGIQGRQYPLNTSEVISLGTSHHSDGLHTLALGDRDGIFIDSQSIFLKDKQTGMVTNLSKGDYTFTASQGLTEGRFEIVYQPQIVLATDTKVKEGVRVYRDSDNYIIQSPKIIAEMEVYDLSGKLILVWKPNTKQVSLDASRISNGINILKIVANDGEVTNRKIAK